MRYPILYFIAPISGAGETAWLLGAFCSGRESDAWFPAPMLGSSQLPAVSSLLRGLHSCAPPCVLLNVMKLLNKVNPTAEEHSLLAVILTLWNSVEWLA